MEARRKIKKTISCAQQKSKRKKSKIKVVTLFVLSVLVSRMGYIFFYHTFGIKINYKRTQLAVMSTTDIYYPSQQYYLDHQPALYASYQQIFPTHHLPILPYVDNNAMLLANIGKTSASNNKVKTSLCKKWAQFGTCPYLHKCQFAHGIQQLRCNVDENSYKTRHCNAFFKKGYCPYGFRCNFSHKQRQAGEENSQKLDKQTILGYHEILKTGTKQEGKSRVFDCSNHKLDESDSKSIGSTEDCRSQSLCKSRLGYIEDRLEGPELNFMDFSSSMLCQPAQPCTNSFEGDENNNMEVNQSLLSFNIDYFC